MKVKALVDEDDITKGHIYSVVDYKGSELIRMVYVINDSGEPYPLFINEYEVVED